MKVNAFGAWTTVVCAGMWQNSYYINIGGIKTDH